MNLLIFAFAAAWWITGILSFRHWARKDQTLPTPDWSMSILSGIVGPVAWIIGRQLLPPQNTLPK